MPDCDHRWAKNGGRTTARWGLVRRLICVKCGEGDKHYERDPNETKLRALALLATRLPRSEAEWLTGLKSETIRDHLVSVVGEPACWAETRKKLVQLGLTDDEVNFLGSLGTGASRCAPGSGPLLNADLAALKARIESITGDEVVIAPSRQGVRVCRKKDFDDLIRNAKNLPARRPEYARLSQQELIVLRQLRTPSSQARVLSRIFDEVEMTIDPVTMKPLPAEPTPTTLAMGLRMEFDVFKGIVIRLVRKLRKLSTPRHHRIASSSEDHEV
jgi:hypothetical protein